MKKKPATLVATPSLGPLSIQIFFRADKELADALDQEVDRLNAGKPWLHMKRSDLVRELCWKALNADKEQ